MKLNLGCGEDIKPGFINIDINPCNDNVVKGNALDLDFKSDSVKFIYSSHLIEHFDRKEIETFFKECNRVLKSGGGLYLIAPSIERIITEYCNGEIDISYLDNFLYGLQLHKHNFHKQGIYKNKLIALCADSNFIIERITYQNREHSDNEITLKARKA